MVVEIVLSLPSYTLLSAVRDLKYVEGGGYRHLRATPPAPPLVAAHVAACPAVHLQTHSEHADKATCWEDSAELDELEAAERVRVVQIREFFEVSQHVAQLAIIY